MQEVFDIEESLTFPKGVVIEDQSLKGLISVHFSAEGLKSNRVDAITCDI